MIRRTHSMILIASAALLVSVLGAAAHAQGDGPGRRGPFGHGGPGRGGVPGLGRLDLTDAQREQVRDIMQRYRGQMQDARQRLGEAHKAQRDAVETVPVNEQLIRSTTQVLANAQTDMALLRARIHNDIWSVLTPDQQEKAKQLRSQREARMKRRVGKE